MKHYYHKSMENGSVNVRGGAPKASRKSEEAGHSLTVEVGSILLFAICVFTLVTLFTYNPADPSLFSTSRAPATNACGRVGAEFAALLIQWFGLGAFLAPAAQFFMAMTIFRREGSARLFGTLGGMTVAVISLSVFLTLNWKFWPYSGALILTGGAFGAWVADLLVRQFNPFGSMIVSLLVFFLAIALSTPLSVARLGAAILGFVGQWGWRLLKLMGTYLLFLGGLAAMRAAHAAGDLLQKLIEGAIRRARERGVAAREARITAPRGPGVQLPLPLELPEPTGNELAMASKNEEQNEQPDEEGEKGSENPDFEIGPEKAALKAAGKKGIALSNGDLEIVPREASESLGTEEESGLVNKAAARLAKAASRAAKRGNWSLPTLEFLRKPPKVETAIDRERLKQNAEILEQKFADFDIEGQVTAARPGPVITLYEFKPGPGVKVSRIAALADDLSMALSARSVRIVAPLPGKPVVGIEIPSENRETVYMREIYACPDFHGPKYAIPVAMGKDIAGQTYLADLAKMPHLLCAGQTGSGKSVFMNGLICSLLYRFTPDELRLILVDPKFIEFRAYQDIPHLLLPVVDDPVQASIALKWAVREMDRRYRILAKVGARNLAGFNQKCQDMGADVIRDLLLAEENQDGEDGLQTAAPVKAGSDWIEAFEPDETGAPKVGKLPYIVIIIDELADLMMIAKKEVEISIARIAQKARAAGIHLVIATQRPSTDVITGLIKANLPSRASFQLASFVDSKTILDRAGAERLLGQGDMLFVPPGTAEPLRLHAGFLDDDEITKITSFLKAQGKPAYRDEILISEEDEDGGDGMDAEDDDALFGEAMELAKQSGHVSASFLQRHLKVGYNRAARMVETMEKRGIVGPADGARPREVLIR
jgi:DNA segregation ATPase FtsK/SpoIIIE, S-DNA-T family